MKQIENKAVYYDQSPESIYKRDYWEMLTALHQTPEQSHHVALASSLRRAFMPLRRTTNRPLSPLPLMTLSKANQ